MLIENCLVDTGDDAICLKSDNPDFRMTNVTVRNCTVASQCCAFKIGTASRGMVSGIEFSDSQIVACDFSSGRKAAVIHDTMKDIRGVTDERTGMSAFAVENVDGAVLRDVTVKDIIFDGYATPFFVRFGSRSPSSRTDGLPPRLENVVFAARNIKVFVFGTAVVFGIKIAVLVKHLGVMDKYARAALCLDAHLDVAGHILTKVDNALAPRRFDKGDRRNSFLLGYPLADLLN